MYMDRNREIVADIKNKLQYPMTTLELIAKKGIDRNKIPREFFEDALTALRQTVRLLNKLAGWRD